MYQVMIFYGGALKFKSNSESLIPGAINNVVGNRGGALELNGSLDMRARNYINLYIY